MSKDKYTVQYTDENPAIAEKGSKAFWVIVMLVASFVYFIASIVFL